MLHWVNELADSIQHLLLPLGGWGLGPAAFLDSSFLTLAGGFDLWLISLVIYRPEHAPLYVLIAAIGSTAGTVALYLAVRRSEEAFLSSPRKLLQLERVQKKMQNSAMPILLLSSVLPPPMPFKVFVIAAGLLRYSFPRFLIAMVVSRFIRYGLIALLAVTYGRRSWELLLHAGPWALAVSGAIVLALYLILKPREDNFSAT